MTATGATAQIQDAPPAARRGNTFDFLRLFAASTVVVGHGVLYMDQSFFWFDKGLGSHFWFADGVAMFFVMSGLLVYRSAERTRRETGGWTEYARNRALRIMPAIYAYTIVVALALVIIGAVPLGDMASPGVLIWLASSFLLVPGYDPAAFSQFGLGELNSSLWTIPAEVSFYVAIPVLYLLAGRIGSARMLALLVPVAIAAPIIGHAAGGPLGQVIHLTFLEYLICFGLGVFWSRYWHRAPQHWCLFVATVVLYFAAHELTRAAGLEDLLRPLTIAIPLSYATVWFGYRGPQALRKITDRVGDISFGTYIWHLPIINLFLWKGWDLGRATVPVILVVAWAVASVSWRLVERPFLLRKRVSERAAETGSVVPTASP